jgi:DNA-binding transcriptional MerR regulator
MSGKVNISDLRKLYYSISEVAEMFDVNMSLIRFWEKEFPILQPKKNGKGNRSYSPKEIEKLARIYDLVKVKGYTLEGAKKALKSRKVTEQLNEELPAGQASNDVIRKLEEVRSKLLLLRSKI